MSTRIYGPNENLTLTEEELARCRPTGSGQKVRAFCPFHGSDHQRSLQVNLETGYFRCFACSAWGYMAEQREQRRAAFLRNRQQSTRTVARTWQPPQPQPRPPAQPCRTDLAEVLAHYQAALPGSLGETYLRRRRIPLEIAQQYGLGYAAPGAWAHVDERGNTIRQWKYGRVIFPHHAPDGTVINLYGRAIDTPQEAAPKGLRHDHLPGQKGYFHASALAAGSGPVFVCEGPFDALSLIAAGYRRAIAIFGVNGWRWDWARSVQNIILALDADATGQQEWRALARAACLRGKQVAWLPAEAYGGQKDVSKAWQEGVLDVGTWPGTIAPSTLPSSVSTNEPDAALESIQTDEGAPAASAYDAYLNVCLQAGVAQRDAVEFALIMVAVQPEPLWTEVRLPDARPAGDAWLLPQWDARTGILSFRWHVLRETELSME